MSHLGKYLFIAGVLIALAGLLLWAGGNRLAWIGNLPGDIRIVRGQTRIYIPVTTMILLSLCATLIAWIVRRMLNG